MGKKGMWMLPGKMLCVVFLLFGVLDLRLFPLLSNNNTPIYFFFVLLSRKRKLVFCLSCNYCM